VIRCMALGTTDGNHAEVTILNLVPCTRFDVCQRVESLQLWKPDKRVTAATQSDGVQRLPYSHG
jgi:hypothetical protein